MDKVAYGTVLHIKLLSLDEEVYEGQVHLWNINNNNYDSSQKVWN